MVVNKSYNIQPQISSEGDEQIKIRKSLDNSNDITNPANNTQLQAQMLTTLSPENRKITREFVLRPPNLPPKSKQEEEKHLKELEEIYQKTLKQRMRNNFTKKKNLFSQLKFYFLNLNFIFSTIFSKKNQFTFFVMNNLNFIVTVK